MEPLLKEIIGDVFYRKCFKKVVSHNDREGDNEAQMT